MQTILGVVCEQAAGTCGKNINVSFDIEPWKINQADHTIYTCQKINPKKIILFLDDEQQPTLTRWMNGHISSYIASKISSHVDAHPTILSVDLLRKLDDRDIFGNF